MNHCTSDIFKNAVIYFYKFTKKEETELEILKKIIVLGGGTYINELIPSTTHIIVNIHF